MKIRFRIILIYWTAAIILLPSAVYAYIDPATTTYLIQIMTALVVTLGVSLSIFLYRFRIISSKIKYWFFGVLYRFREKSAKRDGVFGQGNTKGTNSGSSNPKDTAFGSGTETGETAAESKNNGVAVLPDYVLAGADGPPELSSFDEKIRSELESEQELNNEVKKKKNNRPLRTYKQRMAAALPLALAFSFTFVFIGCLELAIQDSPEMPFKISQILPIVSLVFAGLFVFLILVVPLFRGKLYELLVSFGFAALLGGYLQGNFLNWGIGQLTGDAINWSALKPQFAASILCWIACFVIVLFLWRRFRKTWRGVLLFAPILLILVQGVSILSSVQSNVNEGIWGNGVFWQQADQSLTIHGINQVAPGKNAIVLLLDRLDEGTIQEIAGENPNFFDPLDGFTEFDDYIQYDGSTFPAVTGFLTGHRYQFDMPENQYYQVAWADAKLWPTLKANGVDLRFYMTQGTGYNNAEQLHGLASNAFVGNIDINTPLALHKLLKLSAYRYAPMPFKQRFWLSTFEFQWTIELTDQTAPYMLDDIAYYNTLKANGLSILPGGKDAFTYIHLQGPHAPWEMNADIQKVEKSTMFEQAQGSFKIVYEYLDQLRQLGLYKNSLIIIMGDHNNYLGGTIDQPALTGLLVKPPGSAGTPLQFDHAPVSPDQFLPTISQALTGDTGGLGKTFFDVKEGDPVVREVDLHEYKYEVTGDGREWSNWKYLGKISFPYQFGWN